MEQGFGGKQELGKGSDRGFGDYNVPGDIQDYSSCKGIEGRQAVGYARIHDGGVLLLDSVLGRQYCQIHTAI